MYKCKTYLYVPTYITYIHIYIIIKYAEYYIEEKCNVVRIKN